MRHIRAAINAAARVHGVVLLAPALWLGGCLIGPNYEPPSAPVADHWLEAADPAVDTTRQEYAAWWRVFDDPVLEQLIATAYRQNLTLLMAGIRVLESRAQLGLAIGELYPQQQQAAASVSYNRIPLSLPYNIVDNTYWQSFFGAQAAWELDVWGKVRRGIQSADNAFLASVASYDDLLVTLTGDVASTYVQIRTLEERMAIARANIEKQQLALKIARARFHGGVVTKRDVYQAENVLASTAAAIPELTIELQQAKNALSVLLGMPPGGVRELLDTASAIPVAPAQVAAGIPAELLRRRPDVRHAELQAAAQCAQIGVAKADLLPAFSLVGNVGTLSTDIGRASLGDVFTSKSVAYSVGPAVQWNVLNYGRISNNVRVQDARFQELLVGYQSAVLDAQQEVENGIAVFVQSRQQVALLEASADAARGALSIAMNEYKDGTADFTTVLNAEQNLLEAEDNLAVARGNVPLGLIAVYRALGGGWQIRDGNDFVPRETAEEMSERTDWGTLLTPELLAPEAPGLPGPEDASPSVRPPEW
ncbi:MAG: efflux transporter outer membrane subunit [Candidatus Binatia bacterium]